MRAGFTALLVLACLAGALALTGCGGGGSMSPEPVDQSSLEYKQWLWEVEGGDPASFTLDAFCKVQPEHCHV